MLALAGDALFFSLLLAVPTLEYAEIGAGQRELILDEVSKVRLTGMPCLGWNEGCGSNVTEVELLTFAYPPL